MMQRNMSSSQLSRKRRAEAAVDAATTSSQRVTTRAKTISQSISNRNERCRTDPFNKVELDDEDSLVTSIENVIATSNEQCATSSEISGDRPLIKKDLREP